MLLVMFFLVGNIFPYGGDIRFADAENSVACLPSKIWAPFFSNPTRGIFFFDAGKFGPSPGWTRTHEHVDVIGGGAGDQRGPVDFSKNGPEKGGKVRSKFKVGQRGAFARAEIRWGRMFPHVCDIFLPPLPGWLSFGAPPPAFA